MLFGDPRQSPPALQRALDALRATPLSVAGLLAAPAEGACAWAKGQATTGFAAVALPQRLAAEVELLGVQKAGEELEIFEASAQRGKGAEIQQSLGLELFS